MMCASSASSLFFVSVFSDSVVVGVVVDDDFLSLRELLHHSLMILQMTLIEVETDVDVYRRRRRRRCYRHNSQNQNDDDDDDIGEIVVVVVVVDGNHASLG